MMKSRRPVLLIDCDGVLSDFHARALDHHYALTGRRYGPLPENHPLHGKVVRHEPHVFTTWCMYESLPPSERAFKEAVFSRMKAKGECLNLPVMPGAVEGLAPIAELADIYVVTTPFEGGETWMSERNEWVSKHFPYVKGVVHTSEKRLVHGNVFVDDKRSNVQAWLKHWSEDNVSGINGDDWGCIHTSNGYSGIVWKETWSLLLTWLRWHAELLSAGPADRSPPQA
jgi:hypothetical protein